ncbi:MAG: SDR family NAD(P)-dependent oxidoreductase, partial [Pseudomonadota bacterium]
AAAFRFMAQARHIGKIVLAPEEATRAALDHLSPDASYLVTGGLAGLGLLSAEHLAARGARHLALVARRAPDARALQSIERLRAAGVAVLVLAEDIASADGVARVFQAIDAALPPLRGIIHSAGALDDGALPQQSWSRFLVPLGAKVNGAWALHVHSAQRRLDFFLLYSSVASVLGSSGQANHSAANAFLDALAVHRRALGLPAQSISWGAWSEIGAAAERGVGERVGALGIALISPAHGLELLSAATRSDAPHVVALPVAWPRFLAQRAPNGRALFTRMADRHLAAAVPSGSKQAAATAALDLEALADASAAQRYSILLAFVTEHVARVIGVPQGGNIAVDQPLNELGLDSLMAVDLRNRLSRGLGQARSLPATLVFDHPTLAALAEHLATLLTPARAAEAALPPPIPRDALGAIDTLSDEQIEALFAKRIGSN